MINKDKLKRDMPLLIMFASFVSVAIAFLLAARGTTPEVRIIGMAMLCSYAFSVMVSQVLKYFYLTTRQTVFVYSCIAWILVGCDLFVAYTCQGWLRWFTIATLVVGFIIFIIVRYIIREGLNSPNLKKEEEHCEPQ